MMTYRLRTRIAADLPWSDYVTNAPVELLLNLVRKCQADGIVCIRLEERPGEYAEDGRLVVELHADHGQCSA